jgi:AcrR family transcriptional regulator
MTGQSVERARRAKRRVVAEFRHTAILEAARRVFAAKGFDGACVEDIARQAGVAKGTIYLYYPSKSSIYSAALRQGLAALCRELRRRVEAAAPGRDKLLAFVETKLAFVEAHRDFYRIYSAALGNSPKPLRCHKDFKAFYQEQIAILQAALAPARDGETAAYAVFDVVRGVVERRLYGGSGPATDAEVAGLLDLLWKGISRR